VSYQSEEHKRNQARIDLVQNDHYTRLLGRVVTVGQVRVLAQAFNRTNQTAKFIRECRKVKTGMRGGGMRKACYVPGTVEAGKLAMLVASRERYILDGLRKGGK